VGDIGDSRGELKKAFEELKNKAKEIVALNGYMVVFGVVDKDGQHAGEILMQDGDNLEGLVFMLKSVINGLERPVDGVC